MTFYQYKLLKGLYDLHPKMDDEQKYPLHFVNDVEKKTKMSTEDVLAVAKELEQLGFVNLGQNKEDAKERGGYIHLIRITYNGVVAQKNYILSGALSLLRNIIIPAIVSIGCSLIVNYLCK